MLALLKTRPLWGLSTAAFMLFVALQTACASPLDGTDSESKQRGTDPIGTILTCRDQVATVVRTPTGRGGDVSTMRARFAELSLTFRQNLPHEMTLQLTPAVTHDNLDDLDGTWSFPVAERFYFDQAYARNEADAKSAIYHVLRSNVTIKRTTNLIEFNSSAGLLALRLDPVQPTSGKVVFDVEHARGLLSDSGDARVLMPFVHDSGCSVSSQALGFFLSTVNVRGRVVDDPEDLPDGAQAIFE